MKKILCAGQMVADILIKPIESFDYSIDTRIVETIQFKSGGDAMNTAIAMGKLGADITFAGRVGDDAQGEYLKDRLIDANVIPLLSVDGGASTSSCAALISSSGERAFLYCAGANANFSSSDVPEQAIAEAFHVHLGGIYNLPAFDGENAASLLKKVKAIGKTTSMDVTYDSSGCWYGTVAPMLPYLDYFMPSIGEAKYIAGSEDPEQAADFFMSMGVGTVVIKLGKDGCLIKNKSVKKHIPAYPMEAADTTGAGDSFCAGFLYGLANDFSLEDCARAGNGTAAFCVTTLGATEGVPRWSAVEKLIAYRR